MEILFLIFHICLSKVGYVPRSWEELILNKIADELISWHVRQVIINKLVIGLPIAAAALIPPLIVEYTSLALLLMLALAAETMVYVVVHEVVPEICGHEHDEPLTIGFFTGFTAMLLLDTLLV